MPALQQVSAAMITARTPTRCNTIRNATRGSVALRATSILPCLLHCRRRMSVQKTVQFWLPGRDRASHQDVWIGLREASRPHRPAEVWAIRQGRLQTGEGAHVARAVAFHDRLAAIFHAMELHHPKRVCLPCAPIE